MFTVGKFKVDILADDQYIGACLSRGHEWDAWMRQDLPHLVKPGTDILDIGGNIGWNALMFSDYGPVHTFEPLYHPIAQKNVDQNMTTWPITVHPYGLSSSEATVPIYQERHNSESTCNYGGTTLVPHDVSGYDRVADIQVKRLDDAYAGTPCLIKIDVENHELEVLKGAAQTIRQHLPHMYVEIFDFDDGPVPKFLKELGYTQVVKRPEHNYLFVSPLKT